MVKDFLEVMAEGAKLGITAAGAGKKIAHFDEKLVGFLDLITNKKGMSSNTRAYLMHEAESTADFPYLFGTVLERSLYAQYKAITPDWRDYIKTGTQNDFRPQWVLGVYGLQGQLQQVSLRAEYPQDGNLADGKVQIILAKYGRQFGLAWEAVINDDLGAFSDISERLSKAAVRTEYKYATQLYAAAAGGGNTSLFGTALAHPIDGALINNKNTGAGSAFSITTLGSVASQMRRFTDPDGEPVMFDGFELVVPPALEIPMLQALNPANIIQSGGDSTAGVKAQIRSSSNTIPMLNITGHVNPYLPIVDTTNGNTGWYLFASLAGTNGGYAARINFLRGHETPELCMRNPNKLTLGGASMSPLEGDFESDSINWRLRHVFGGTVVDPRYAVFNAGA
jgi:hypothetical protein